MHAFILVGDTSSGGGGEEYGGLREGRVSGEIGLNLSFAW
jgi:hypothetical protein